MSAEQLHAFLFTEEGKPDGWLQEFIEPQGPYTNTIRATWSPCVTRIEVRTNRHQLTDRKVCAAGLAVPVVGVRASDATHCAPTPNLATPVHPSENVPRAPGHV